MAAIYLHNAIFQHDPSALESSLGLSPHARSISTVSTGNLPANTSEYSHPTGPLLNSLAYLDLLESQPPYPNGPHTDLDMRLNLGGNPTTISEMKHHWEKTIRRRLRRLRCIETSLEVLFSES